MQATSELTIEQAGQRTLAVLYRMSDGVAGIAIPQKELMAECTRLRVFAMSEDEFRAFVRQTVAVSNRRRFQARWN